MTSASDELAYLKSLVSQLTVKINDLEAKAASKKPTPSPAQQLRTILVGPPGAGVCRAARVFARALSRSPLCTFFLFLLMLCVQARVHRHRAYARSFVSAILRRVICFVSKSRRRHRSVLKLRRSWMPVGSSRTISWWA